MNKYPKISIVTVNYNGALFLEETILSVLGQGYPNLEYIIIDGGSNDGSVDIIKKYQDKLAYWVSEPDNGMYHALQKGFFKSTGEIMAWINADDIYHPKSLFSVAEIFSISGIEWIVGNPSRIDSLGRTVFCHGISRWSKYDYYSYDYKFIQQESIFWKRSLWEKAGGHISTELKYAGDMELWLRFFRYAQLFPTTALLGGFRQWSINQLSINNMQKYCDEAEYSLRQEQLSEQDRIIIRKFNIAKKISAFLKKMKIFNHLLPINRVKYRYFDYAPVIRFDSIEQKFVIEKIK